MQEIIQGMTEYFVYTEKLSEGEAQVLAHKKLMEVGMLNENCTATEWYTKRYLEV